MAAIIWGDVTNQWGTYLTTLGVPAQTAILAHVNVALDVRLFADGEIDGRLFLARCALAAHMGTLELQAAAGAGSGAAGPVTAESAGTLSRSYANSTSSGGAASSDPLLDTTAPGRMYRMLMRPLRGVVTL